MYDTQNLPVVTVKFRHAVEFMLKRKPEHEGLQTRIHLDGDDDCFQVIEERHGFNTDFVTVLAKCPFGAAALHFCIIGKDGGAYGTSYILRAIPDTNLGGLSVENGPNVPYEVAKAEIEKRTPPKHKPVHHKPKSEENTPKA